MLEGMGGAVARVDSGELQVPVQPDGAHQLYVVVLHDREHPVVFEPAVGAAVYVGELPRRVDPDGIVWYRSGFDETASGRLDGEDSVADVAVSLTGTDE